MPDYTPDRTFVAIAQQLQTASLPEVAAFLVWEAVTLHVRGHLSRPYAHRVVTLIDMLLLGIPPDDPQELPRAA